MNKKKHEYAARLAARQKTLIDDIAAGSMDLPAALAKNKVSRQLYNRWLSRPVFAQELAFRQDCTQQQSRMILSRFAPAAAARLVALTESDREETVRRACLDVIALAGRLSTAAENENDADRLVPDAADTAGPDISPQAAARILEILAGDVHSAEQQAGQHNASAC